LRKSGGGRREQLAVPGSGRQNAFHQFQAEWQRRTDQFRILVSRISRAGRGERVTDPVGGEPLHRAA